MCPRTFSVLLQLLRHGQTTRPPLHDEWPAVHSSAPRTPLPQTCSDVDNIPMMPTRHLYVVRHGAADAFGNLTAVGERQTAFLGERLSRSPITAVWHSPLPRATRTATLLAAHLPGVPVAEAPELIDHVPHVPTSPPRPGRASSTATRPTRPRPASVWPTR
ncbi:histidine phosphatase family protein [Lentzea sp. NPDC058450]|uniref:histidine phosphatase family protein n=1 Tax=Lentzea sp. NPDC058450 TaxID=3346505 RepID=UPI003656E5B7